jgi:hypothetical protein
MSKQDAEVHDFRVRLGRVLALVRILAGRRGHARVTWWGLGFGYTLTVTRTPSAVFEIDDDPDAIGGTEVRALLRDALDYPDGP